MPMISAPRVASARIASAPQSPYNPRPQKTEFVFTPGRHNVVPSGMNDPAARFTRVHMNDVMSIVGLDSMSYGTKTPAEVTLKFDTAANAQLADAALKDTVLGAKLVYADVEGNRFDFKPNSYSGSPTNIARVIAAMPGVVKYRHFGVGSYLMTPDSLDTRVRLQQLVSREFNGKMGYWQGECFGPKCPVDPPPPNGEIPESSVKAPGAAPATKASADLPPDVYKG